MAYYAFNWHLSWPESMPPEQRAEVLRAVQRILGERWPGAKFIVGSEGSSFRILIPVSDAAIPTEQLVRNWTQRTPAGQAQLN